MQYCKRCLYPSNHALNIIFDDRGLCSGCIVHEEKYEINWDGKARELEGLVDQYRDRPGSSYDCIVPVSGAGDDYFVVDYVKNQLRLNPLLVTYNTHFSSKVGVRNLARLISELDCDHMISTVGPDTVKEITRVTLEKFGDMYWHVLAGSQTFPVQVATKLNIPLIIWGVNGWLDQVGMFSHHDQVEMTKKVRKEHAMRHHDASELIGASDLITEKDLQAFTYPSDEQLEKSRVRGIYLGNFVFWDSKTQIELMIDKYGYESMAQERTYNSYESIACCNNASVHDYVKFLKFGYGKVSDHVARDIRLKRLSREDGVALIIKYEEVVPEALQKFLEWIEWSEDTFYSAINKHRDSRIWSMSEDSGWYRLDSVQNHIKGSDSDELSYRLDSENCYRITDLLEPAEAGEGYVLLGRTYMDEENFRAEDG